MTKPLTDWDVVEELTGILMSELSDLLEKYAGGSRDDATNGVLEFKGLIELSLSKCIEIARKKGAENALSKLRKPSDN